jgi:D-alanyl-D-alanine carboxypeptidase
MHELRDQEIPDRAPADGMADSQAGPVPEAGTGGRRRPGLRLVGAGAVLVLALAACAAHDSSRPSMSEAGTMEISPKDAVPATEGPTAQNPAAAKSPASADDGGAIPAGRDVSPFDTQYSAVGKLDSRLLKALQKAAKDAQHDDIVFRVTSGWRSREHQQRLLDEGIQKYGSLEKARQFVSTPEKSRHVSGKAVDIGPTDADDWLIQHGSGYGLCQAYTNEMWHFELLTSPGGTCPVPLVNAAG